MFENCSAESRPSVLKLSHYPPGYFKLKEEKEKEVKGKPYQIICVICDFELLLIYIDILLISNSV